MNDTIQNQYTVDELGLNLKAMLMQIKRAKQMFILEISKNTMFQRLYFYFR